MDKIINDIDDYQKEILNNIQKRFTNNYLIPQFWWGDISDRSPSNEKMKAVILGKNPSLECYKYPNDISDNKEYHKELTKNLKLDNRDNDIRDLLINKNDSFFHNWWIKEAFKDIELKTMKGIAIYNLFGFYSKSLPDNIDIRLSHIYQIEEIKNHIIKQIKNSNHIFLMWISSWNMWKEVLGEEVFENKDIYVVNLKGNYNKSILNAVPFKKQQLDIIYDESIINKRKNDIKKIFEQ